MTTAVSSSPPRNMTFEEFLTWAFKQNDRVELVDGKVEYMSPVSLAHQELTRFLLTLMIMLADTRQLGQVFFEDFLMKTGPHTGREPDIIFVAADHLDRVQETFLNGPGDLCIEVVSPESQTRDRKTKLAEYRRLGVPEYWVLDPEQREALFYQLQADGDYLPVSPDSDNVYRSRSMPGLWIKIDWLWQRPLPALLEILKQWGVVA
jgi:Uma2 family endonuclease